jgi:hypothetical protein
MRSVASGAHMSVEEHCNYTQFCLLYILNKISSDMEKVKFYIIMPMTGKDTVF